MATSAPHQQFDDMKKEEKIVSQERNRVDSRSKGHRHRRNRVGQAESFPSSFLPLPSGSGARAHPSRSAALPPARASLEPCLRIPLARCPPFPNLAGARRRPELPGAPPQSPVHTSLHQQLPRSELNFSCKYSAQSLSVSNLAARRLQFHLPHISCCHEATAP